MFENAVVVSQSLVDRKQWKEYGNCRIDLSLRLSSEISSEALLEQVRCILCILKVVKIYGVLVLKGHLLDVSTTWTFNPPG